MIIKEVEQCLKKYEHSKRKKKMEQSDKTKLKLRLFLKKMFFICFATFINLGEEQLTLVHNRKQLNSMVNLLECYKKTADTGVKQ